MKHFSDFIMDYELPTNKKKDKNFFKVPHKFEEKFGNQLTLSEKYFYIVLLKLHNRLANEDGWFWHVDKSFPTEKDSVLGFKSFGFSVSTCKRARKKLKRAGALALSLILRA